MKKIISLFLVCLMLCNVVFAETGDDTNAVELPDTTTNTNTNTAWEEEPAENNIYIEDIIPHVTIDQISERFYRKGFELIHMAQKLVQPFAVLIFIIGALMTLVGSLGNGQLSGKGFCAMSFSVFVYAGVLYSPVIMESLVSWVVA